MVLLNYSTKMKKIKLKQNLTKRRFSLHLNFEKEAIMLYNCFHFIHKELLMNFTNFYQNLKHLIFSAEIES